MAKRKRQEKEMGGAEKVRAKKKKLLVQDAAKCAKITDLFRGGAAVSQAADDTGPSSTATAG